MKQRRSSGTAPSARAGRSPPGESESEERPSEGAGSRDAHDFPVVAVGASAGGLEAFGDFLRHLASDTGMGFVLVQHLDPSHESMLSSILSRATRMPIREVTERTMVEPNHVYVVPPMANLAIRSGMLELL